MKKQSRSLLLLLQVKYIKTKPISPAIRKNLRLKCRSQPKRKKKKRTSPKRRKRRSLYFVGGLAANAALPVRFRAGAEGAFVEIAAVGSAAVANAAVTWEVANAVVDRMIDY